ETWMELGGLAAQRRDRDRVLEQPARVGVMGVGRRRQGAHALAEDSVSDEAIEQLAKPRMRDLGRKEVEKAVEILDLAPRLGGARARPSSGRRSRNRSTRPSTRTASPSRKRLSRRSTSFQTRASIRPLESTSSSARYGFSPRVRRRCLRASAK